jgi:hypothetical protein
MKAPCRQCGKMLTNLLRDVGEERAVYPGPVRDYLCIACHMQKAERLIARTRKEMGLGPKAA